MNEAQIGRRVDRPNNNYINDGRDELGGFYEVGKLKDGDGFLHELFLEEMPNESGKLFKVYSPWNSFEGELAKPFVIGNIKADSSSEYDGSNRKSTSEILIGIKNNGNKMVYSLKALKSGELTLSLV